MAHPFSQLKNLLSSANKPQIGMVVEAGSRIIRVRTGNGIKEFPVNLSIAVSSGDQVSISNGLIISVVRPVENLPIFDL